MPRAIRAERDAAAREGRAPRLAELLDAWGGVDHRLSPPADRLARRYTLNHEEVAKALEEGIRFAEGLTPVAVEVDRFGHARAAALAQVDGDSRAADARGRAAGAHDPGRGRHAAQHRAGARGRRRTSRSTASISRRSTRTGKPVTPERGSPSRTPRMC